MAYQVRNWDSFYENYAMIPREFDSREEAIEFAEEYIREELGGAFDPFYNEMQVWVDNLTKGAWQMVGYIEVNCDECDELVFEFEKCFC